MWDFFIFLVHTHPFIHSPAADNNGIGTFQGGYDYIICCLGFKFNFSIFTRSANPIPDSVKKYPDLLTNYESSSVPDMFFGENHCIVAKVRAFFLYCSVN